MRIDAHGRPIEVGATVRRVPDHHTYRVDLIRPVGLSCTRDDGQPAWLAAGAHIEVDTGTPRPVGGVGDVAQTLLNALPPGPVRDLVAERRERGLITYGRPLAAYGDGLDTWRDLLRPELGDVLVYFTRWLAEQSQSTGSPPLAAAQLLSGLLGLLGASEDELLCVLRATSTLAAVTPCPACDGAGDNPTCPTCGSPTW